MKSIKNIALTLILALLPFVALSLSGTASALDTTAACGGAAQVDDSGQACGSGSPGVDDVIHTVINILGIIVGIVAVIMIILSGFKYMTSSGDANKAGSAKTTLIYALIGLVIAGLAQILVHFVLNTSTNAATPCPGQAGVTELDAKCKATH